MTNQLSEHEKRALAEFESAVGPIEAALASRGITPVRLRDYQGIYANEAAIDVFDAHLDGAYPDNVKAIMVNAMASPRAEYLFDKLVARLRREVDAGHDSFYVDGLAWTISRSISTTASLQKLGSLALDKSLGKCRIFFLDKLKSIKDQAVVELLEELAKDPQLSKEIRSWKAYWRKRNPAILSV